MNQRHNQQGFTVVELMLAMAFIALLLVAIAMTVIRIGGTYSKGLTIASVNQAGRTIVDDMKRTLSQDRPFDLTTAYKTQVVGQSKGGRLCGNYYAYVWNLNKRDDESVNSNARPINKFDSGQSVNLVKVRNNGTNYCALDASGNYPAVKQADATRLLADDDPLALFSVDVSQLTQNLATSRMLYKVKMTINSAESGDVVELNSVAQCKPPSEEANQNYCAVNDFTFTVQAGNAGEGNQ